MKIIAIITLVVTALPVSQELIDALGILRAQIEQEYIELGEIESLLPNIDNGSISVTSQVLPYLSINDTDIYDLDLTDPEVSLRLTLNDLLFQDTVLR